MRLCACFAQVAACRAIETSAARYRRGGVIDYRAFLEIRICLIRSQHDLGPAGIVAVLQRFRTRNWAGHCRCAALCSLSVEASKPSVEICFGLCGVRVDRLLVREKRTRGRLWGNNDLAMGHIARSDGDKIPSAARVSSDFCAPLVHLAVDAHIRARFGEICRTWIHFDRSRHVSRFLVRSARASMAVVPFRTVVRRTYCLDRICSLAARHNKAGVSRSFTKEGIR